VSDRRLEFIDLKRQYAALKDRIAQRMQRVLDHGQYIMGPEVQELEAQLAARTGAKHCITVASGTEALLISLMALDLKPGDEVITTPFTFAATAEMIVLIGGVPVFIDIEPDTGNIDASLIEAAVTPRTKAIMPVGLYGQVADMDASNAVAARHDLAVIEDAAQSFGANWAGQPIGTTGDFVSFSFHANKNITTIEGGCLVMNDEHEAKLAEQYRLQGVVRSGLDGMEVERVGGKYNLTDVAARVGLGQLPHLDEFTQKRRALARHYFACFDGGFLTEIDCRLPVADFTQSNWHMFQVILPEAHLAQRKMKRADVMAALDGLGIGTGVHYPALHLFALYRRLGWQDGDFPHAEYAGRNTLTLPLFPTMTDADVERVVEALQSVLRGALKN
jgi:dTDP-4-amino-4,6-dideoxygalactose transaminase